LKDFIKNMAKKCTRIRVVRLDEGSGSEEDSWIRTIRARVSGVRKSRVFVVHIFKFLRFLNFELGF